MPAQSPIPLAATSETGALGVMHLKRLWSRTMASRTGLATQPTPEEMQWDRLTMDALGIGLRQTLTYVLGQAPDFPEFEQWIIRVAGAPSATQVARLNAALCHSDAPPEVQASLDAIDGAENVLSVADLAHWEKHGFVIVRESIDESLRAEAERLLWELVHAEPDDPDSWYRSSGIREGITVESYQHPILSAVRAAPRIHKAFAQLWGTADLWSSIDRAGFNPPIRPDHAGSVQKLHWDVSLARPIPFGTQGILYLTDTPAEQGAFRLVPGFHRRLDSWLDDLPAGAIPGQQDLEALGPQPVAGKAGDFVIWNHQLPHGPSPNHGTRPRMVIYLNRYSASYRGQSTWL